MTRCGNEGSFHAPEDGRRDTAHRFDGLWWRHGLSFSCLRCGRCCRGEPGAIYYTSGEEEALSGALGVSIEDFRHRYTTAQWGSPSIGERKNGDCVLYCRETDSCTVYQARPWQCRSFPFWPSLLESRDQWDHAALSCPGMNQGEHHSAEEIHRIISRCPFPGLL